MGGAGSQILSLRHSRALVSRSKPRCESPRRCREGGDCHSSRCLTSGLASLVSLRSLDDRSVLRGHTTSRTRRLSREVTPNEVAWSSAGLPGKWNRAFPVRCSLCHYWCCDKKTYQHGNKYGILESVRNIRGLKTSFETASFARIFLRSWQVFFSFTLVFMSLCEELRAK